MPKFKIVTFAIILSLMNAAFCFNINSNRRREIEVFRLSNQFYQYIERIKIALDYMKENVEDLNLDAYFGVLLAKSYLKNINFKNRELDEVLILSDLILKSAQKLDLDDYRYLKNIKKYFMNENNWNRFLELCEEKFKCDIQNDTINYLSKNRITYELLSHSSPNESESDICLSEIIGVEKEKDQSCNISNMCYDAMITGPSIEYSTTHRLLYFMICRTKNCNACGGQPTTLAIENLCCNVMNEALMIEKLKFPTQLKDLFMEQVVLCAMNGYVEILKLNWIELIKYWQRPEGCWGYFNQTTHNQNRRKRSNSSLGPADCSTHSTGLGIALLAIALDKSLCILNLD